MGPRWINAGEFLKEGRDGEVGRRNFAHVNFPAAEARDLSPNR